MVKLNLSYEGFCQQALRLHDLLPEEIKEQAKVARQKKTISKWINKNIKVKP